MPATTPKEILDEISFALQNIEHGNSYISSKKADSVFQAILKFFIFLSTSPLTKEAFDCFSRKTILSRTPQVERQNKEILEYNCDELTNLSIALWIDGFTCKIASLLGKDQRASVTKLKENIESLCRNKDVFQKEITEMRIFCTELLKRKLYNQLNFNYDNLLGNNLLLNFLNQCFNMNLIKELKRDSSHFLDKGTNIQKTKKIRGINESLFSTLKKCGDSQIGEPSYQAVGELLNNMIEHKGAHSSFLISRLTFVSMLIIFLIGFFTFIPRNNLFLSITWLIMSFYLGACFQQYYGSSNFNLSSLNAQEANFIYQKLNVFFQFNIEQKNPGNPTSEKVRAQDKSNSPSNSLEVLPSDFLSGLSDTSGGILIPRNPAYRPNNPHHSAQKPVFRAPIAIENTLDITWDFDDANKIPRAINYNSLTNEHITTENKVIVFYPFNVARARYFIWWNESYVKTILRSKQQENIFDIFNMLVTSYNPVATARKGDSGLIRLTAQEIKDDCTWKLKQLSTSCSHFRLYFKEFNTGFYRLLVPWSLINN